MKKILFYYPSKNIGGAQILFIRLANHFAMKNEYEVYIVDYSDGYLKSNINNFVKYIDYDYKDDITMSDMIVISPLSMILSIYKDLPNVTGKHLFWGIHTENLIDILRGSFRLRKYINNPDFIIKFINFNKFLKIRRKLLNGLKNRNVFFMDRVNLERSLSFYSIKGDNKTLFVPVPILDIEIRSTKLNKNKMAWIGRLSNDKIFSLLYVLKKINNIVTEKTDFYIIGNGDYEYLIDENEYQKLNIIKKGFFPNDKLQSFLIEMEIGLVFAMGTSMLESSILKIPTMLINSSYKPLSEDYSPKWGFDTEDYVLGSLNLTYKSGHFEKLYKEFLSDITNDIGEKCYRYTKENHSIDNTANLLELYFDSK
ncbi:hypothetical protein ACOL23_01045 [Aliarcobacter butzleri]